MRCGLVAAPRQVISDLLKPESVNLVVREDRRRGVHVEGLSEWVVRSPAGEARCSRRAGDARRASAVHRWHSAGGHMHAWGCPPQASLLTASAAEVYALMERGAAVRATGATKLNEISSRSHAIFMLIVEKSTPLADEDSGSRGGGEQHGAGRGGLASSRIEARQSVKVGAAAARVAGRAR